MVAPGQTIQYLLDTSVCIQLLRHRPAASQISPADSALSSIVEAELWVGVHKHHDPAAKRAELTEFLSLFRIVEFDSAAAGHYGEIRAQLEKQGRVIGPNDLLIAAHARSLGATLVTGNAREFRRVKGLKVLAWK
jgi:tRNA(fMet)-specific endonuclease VapC